MLWVFPVADGSCKISFLTSWQVSTLPIQFFFLTLIRRLLFEDGNPPFLFLRSCAEQTLVFRDIFCFFLAKKPLNARIRLFQVFSMLFLRNLLQTGENVAFPVFLVDQDPRFGPRGFFGREDCGFEGFGISRARRVPARIELVRLDGQVVVGLVAEDV